MLMENCLLLVVLKFEEMESGVLFGALKINDRQHRLTSSFKFSVQRVILVNSIKKQREKLVK